MTSWRMLQILDVSTKTKCEGNSDSIRRWVESSDSRQKSVMLTRGNASCKVSSDTIEHNCQEGDFFIGVVGNFWKVITSTSQQSITVVTTSLVQRQIRFELRRILVTAVQGQYLMNQLRRISSSKVDQVRIEKDSSDSTRSTFNESIAKNFMQEMDVLCKVIVLVYVWCGKVKLYGKKFHW